MEKGIIQEFRKNIPHSAFRNSSNIVDPGTFNIIFDETASKDGCQKNIPLS